MTPEHQPEDLLTPRQLEVLELVSKGLTNREIADVLGIAMGTAKAHVAAVLGALEVSNRTEAIGLLRDSEAGGRGAEEPRHGFLERPALAVLPFDCMGNEDDTPIADGLVEDLTTALSAWRWFPVISRNSTFTFKGTGVDVRKVSRELGARYVLEGSLRREGNRLRVNVKLLDGPSGHHHWAGRYDRTFDDLFAVLDEMVGDIVRVLEPALSQVERLRALRKPPENLTAWEIFQRGLHVLWRQKVEDPRVAGALFRQALEAAPENSAAWAALGMSQLMWAIWGEGANPFEELAAAEKSGARGVACDPMDATAHLTLGAALGIQRRLEEAAVPTQQAVDLNPSYALARFARGIGHLQPGYEHEGIEQLEMAIRLSPLDPMRHHFHGVLAAAHLWVGEHERALEHARTSMAAQPSEALSYAPTLASALGYLGQLEEARAVRDEILAAAPDFSLAASRFLAADGLVDAVGEGLRRFGWEVPG